MEVVFEKCADSLFKYADPEYLGSLSFGSGLPLQPDQIKQIKVYPAITFNNSLEQGLQMFSDVAHLSKVKLNFASKFDLETEDFLVIKCKDIIMKTGILLFFFGKDD